MIKNKHSIKFNDEKREGILMQHRKLGKINLESSLLGFGAMRLPLVEGSTKVDVPEAVRMMRYAIDNGVSYVDTAYVYHGGESEVVVGEALKDGYRDKVILATKNPIRLIEQPEDWDHFLDEQLVRLGTDHIDFYLMHGFRSNTWQKFKEMALFQKALAAKEAGKIKYIGFSFHEKYEMFEEIINAYNWDFCQIQYNYLDVNYQAGMAGLKAATAKGLAVIIMEPLRGGRLAANLPQEISDKLHQANPNYTPVQWALRWLADQPEVSVMLSGMSTMEQVVQNVATCSEEDFTIGCLTDAERATLSDVATTWHARIKIGCTACDYCMPCPMGVNIPGNFALYNNAAMFETWTQAQRSYLTTIQDKKDASQCVSCGACQAACPQGLPIITTLQELDKALRQ